MSSDSVQEPDKWRVEHHKPARLGRKFLRRVILYPFVLLFGVHWIWGRCEQHRLDQRIEELRRSGQPMLAADFLTAPIPDGQNAAIAMRAAVERLTWHNDASRKVSWMVPRLPLDDEELVAIDEALCQNRPAMDLLEEALSRPSVRWNRKYHVLFDDPVPWNGCRNGLDDLLRCDALRLHQDGDDRRAMARVRQLLQLAAAIDHDPIFTAHVAAGNIQALASDALVQMAPMLRIGTAQGVSASEVRAIIDLLLDESPSRKTMIRALGGECLMMRQHWSMAAMNQAARYFCKPVITRWQLSEVEQCANSTRAFRESSDWPSAFLLYPQDVRAQASGEPRWSDPLNMRLIRHQFNVFATRRLAATALAIRLFAVDHQGTFPVTLDELVPHYLSEVPRDPMASAGAKLYYRLRPEGPVLYSVGDNGIDDGGSVDWLPRPLKPVDEHKPSVCDWDRLDFVAHLTPQPRPPRTWPLHIRSTAGWGDEITPMPLREAPSPAP